MAAYLSFVDKGMSSAEAGKQVWKCFPLYHADPQKRGLDPRYVGDNAELPLALKNKVNKLGLDGEIEKDDFERSETMNAAVRSVLRRK